MKYAVDYNKTFRYFNQIDEVVFKYKGTESLVTFIPNLLKSEQRAIINLTSVEIEEIIEYLLLLQKEHENFVVQINYITQSEWIPALKELGINFMFINLASTFEEVYVYASYGVTDIYICEALGFHLKDLQSFREKGIALRVFPDIAQSRLNNVPDLAKFFIRPEGLDIYEDYIDTIELWCHDRSISVTYEIYKQRVWTGYLEDLIIGFSSDFSLHNNALLPTFDEIRVDCGQKCLCDKCHYCERFYNLAPHLAENNQLIMREPDPITTIDENKYKEVLEELKNDKFNPEDMLFE